jgi:hypothetical protein
MRELVSRPFRIVTAALITSLVAMPIARAAGRTDDAEACFEAAEAAQPLMRQNKLRAAQVQLAVCVRDTCPKVVRSDCTAWMDSVSDALPTVRAAAFERRGGASFRLDDVRVLVDGEPLVTDHLGARVASVDPGVHVFRFERAGYAPIEERVDIPRGAKDRPVSATFDARDVAPTRARPPVSTATVLLAGAGVLALGGGIYFEASGLADRSHLESTCKATRTCAQSDVDAARRSVLTGDLLLGASVILLGGATVLYLTRGSAKSTGALRLEIRPLMGGLAAGVEGSL